MPYQNNIWYSDNKSTNIGINLNKEYVQMLIKSSKETLKGVSLVASTMIFSYFSNIQITTNN